MFQEPFAIVCARVDQLLALGMALPFFMENPFNWYFYPRFQKKKVIFMSKQLVSGREFSDLLKLRYSKVKRP